MTKLFASTIPVRCVDLGKESSLPALAGVTASHTPTKSDLPEEDGLYIGYRFVKSIFPYRMQNNYSRTYIKETLPVTVLENDYLRATFVPELGGKLWSLFDKKAEKELLFNNPVMRPAYLATRNAWCSGGVEWNCGILGHTPFTCAPLFATTLTGSEGEPILRMYEYERIRGVVYQMDFSLPEGSKVLFARMRVVNPSYRDTAMYWWSNIAVPEVPKARVVVASDSAYTTEKGRGIVLAPIPEYKGIDVSYPENNPISVDYFFKPKKNRRLFTCQLSQDGYGLFQCSTSRLKGRKIFVWGQGPGGKKWQEYLSGEGNSGRYCEIQCGLANSQYECLPMPPATAWEWLEIYGPMSADPAKVHGTWEEAQSEVEGKINELWSAEALEQRLEDTRETALKPGEKLLCAGQGWGALENMRRAKEGLGTMCPHLDFGKTDETQASWVSLLENGTMGAHSDSEVPASWMRQVEWTDAMETAVRGVDKDNWYTLMELGCTYLAEPNLLCAEHYLKRSLEAKKTPWNLYAMAELIRVQGDPKKAATMMVQASSMVPEDDNLAKIASGALHQAEAFEEQLLFIASCTPRIQELPRLRLYKAFALANLGQVDEAEATILRDGKWLEVPDIQEGENSLSNLWYQIQQVRAERAGTAFDPEKEMPPHALDFRMFVK